MRLRDPVCGMEIGWEEAVGLCGRWTGSCVLLLHRVRPQVPGHPAGHVDVGAWLGEEPPVVDRHACDE